LPPPMRHYSLRPGLRSAAAIGEIAEVMRVAAQWR
jgi:hypothetical protein